MSLLVLVDYVFSYVLPVLIWLPFQISELWRKCSFRKLLNLSEPPPATDKSLDIPGVSRQRISKHLQLFSIDQPPGGPRRLTLLYAWFTARPRHVAKYVGLLSAVGHHVLLARTLPLDAMAPETGTQVIGDEVVAFLRERGDKYDQFAVFACSIGAYVFCETVLKLRRDAALAATVLRRFRGQLYDSALDARNIPVSVAFLLTRRPSLQAVIRACVRWVLRVRPTTLDAHYRRAADVFYGVPVPCRSLFVYSERDAISPDHLNADIEQMWKAKGYDLGRRVFPGSGHVASFARHPGEYRTAVYRFLADTGLAEPTLVDRLLAE